MNFADIFKNSFLQGYHSTTVGTKSVLISLAITAVIGVYIFLIYRMVTRKTFYEKTFNISLIGMAIITAAIILTIQSNIVLSLGMVGALSIVRFRTAIKDPLDLVFLYWSLSIGIICGAGLAQIAIVLSVILTIVVFIMGKIPGKKTPLILVVNSSLPESDKELLNVIKQYCKYYTVKSKTMTPTKLDMVVEVRTDKDSDIICDVLKVSGVISASLLSHDGEITA